MFDYFFYPSIHLGEGHSAAGWGMGSKVRSFGQWAAATCAAPPSVIAGQYATLNCKLLLVRIFPVSRVY